MILLSKPFLLAWATALLARDLHAAPETKGAAVGPEFTVGDYWLHIEATRRVSRRRSADGTLALRLLTAEIDDGLGHPYHGWTDVDFRSLGAAIDATAVPASSRDPENPGILAVTIPAAAEGLTKYLGARSSGGTVMLLVGTLANRKETRTWRDGGGIALVAHARKGRCIVGEWVSYGLVHGAEGTYRLCPKEIGN